MTHSTADIAAYIVELFERTPTKDRTLGYLDNAVELKFPGLGTDQFNYAQEKEMASATLKATGRLHDLTIDASSLAVNGNSISDITSSLGKVYLFGGQHFARQGRAVE
jgi:hypothetical protein